VYIAIMQVGMVAIKVIMAMISSTDQGIMGCRGKKLPRMAGKV
jgi:hypothetical protein